MKDFKGKEISIGDRVLVLWGQNNKIHTGKILNVTESNVTVGSMKNRITISDHNKISKISGPRSNLNQTVLHLEDA